MTNDNYDPLDSEKTIEQPVSEHGTYLLSEGQSLGQYKIIRPLGRGGMGEVYEVEHQVLRRRYALKLLPADFMRGSNALQRFQREAQVMANLEHPNIIRVDEFGETDGRYWLRMEIADGLRPEEDGVTTKGAEDAKGDRIVTLADLAKAYGGKIPQETLLPILRQVLQALDYAHGHGAVHRDLKPSNILLTTKNTKTHEKGISEFSVVKNCTAKIADFGLVRLVGEEWLQSMVQLSVQRSMSIGEEQTVAAGGDSGSEGSSTRSMLGTYEYMSPEQKRGEEADARSDLYSVGLMAYRLLTGRTNVLKLPSRVDRALATGWDDFVEQALEEELGERLKSAKEGLKLLDRVSQDLDADRLKEQQEQERREKEQAAKAQAAREQEEARRKEAEQIALEKARVEEERKRQEEVRRAEMARKAREAAENAAREKLEKTAKKGSGWKWVMGLVIAVAAFAGIRTMMDAPSPQPSAQPARQPAPQPAPATAQPVRTEPVRQAPAVARTGEAVRQQRDPTAGNVFGMAFVEVEAGQSSTPSGMVLIPGGTNAGTDPDFGAYSLTVESFFMDSTPVTKAQWDRVYNWATHADRGTNVYSFDNVGFSKAANHPVQTVSWYDVVKWCNARSEKEGRTPVYTVNGNVYRTGRSSPSQNNSANGYRLPTVIEHQYASRGGLVGKRFPWGDTITHSEANYKSSSSISYDISPTPGFHPIHDDGLKTYSSPKGAFTANEYGLYDMSGNVWEWCWDPSGSRRGIRGGSWNDLADFVRCGLVRWFPPEDARNYGGGFRTVCR